jgi:hypothetical protein
MGLQIVENTVQNIVKTSAVDIVNINYSPAAFGVYVQIGLCKESRKMTSTSKTGNKQPVHMLPERGWELNGNAVWHPAPGIHIDS